MYDQHTTGMATTRHRSLIGRGSRKAVVRDKGLAHNKATTRRVFSKEKKCVRKKRFLESNFFLGT